MMGLLDLRSWLDVTGLLAWVASFFNVDVTRERAWRGCARRACAVARHEVLLPAGAAGLSRVILWPPSNVLLPGGGTR